MTNTPKNKLPLMSILAIATVITFFAGIILFAFMPHKEKLALAIALPLPLLLVAITTVKRFLFIAKLIFRPRKTIEENEDLSATVEFIKSAGSHLKKSYKPLSKKDKVLVLLIFGWFFVCILLMIAGVTIANYFASHKTIGFILMGCSGGGFILWITFIIILSKITR